MAMSLDPDKAPQFLDSMVRKNRIVIVSATYCTFCTKIKMLFIELKQRFVSLEIDVIPNGRELFREVQSRTGVNTVPQVFVRGKYFGGFDDIVESYRKGELVAFLDKKD